ncbi:metallophosphoesterase [Rhizobium sp. BT04]|uniref:metallophosphoesterase family protein n=1 Tax=Rhizobium sp. BT04 TaxID=3045157 RepID=UPI0024B3D19D|nr:metallophosphoesterase [Rhizobium sp. BT04]
MTTPILGITLNELLLVATLVGISLVLFSRYMKKFFKTRGELAVYDGLFIPIQILGWALLVVPVYIYLVSESLEYKQVAIIEFILIIQLPVFTFVLVGVPLLPFFHRTVRLGEIDIKGSTTAQGVRIAHLSDCHLPETTTIEGDLPSASVSKATASALSWALPRSHFVFLTGDVTDTGSPGEWAIFKQLCKQIKLDREKLLVIPGNHDISLETGFSPPQRNITEGFEKRCLNFIANVIVDCPKRWEFVHENQSFKIIDYFQAAFTSYIDEYLKYPPEVSVLPAKPSSIYYLKAPEILRQRADQFERQGLCWPTRSRPLMSNLMEIIFPIVFFHNDEFVIIGLNSNIEGSMGVADGAFGRIGQDQLRRLELLLNVAKGRRVMILVHHHIGMPERIKNKFGRKSYQLKFLQLADARKLLKLIDGHDVVVFHGHKHVAYSARSKKAVIISAGSICYGDIAESRDSAVIFSVPAEGDVQRVSSYSVRA